MDLLSSLRKHRVAMDGGFGNAMGVRENGKWYYEVAGKKTGPFESVEEAKKAALAKGYDW